jgi:hypothetical protein
MAAKLTNYWQEGSTFNAISPASTYNIVGQHNKMGGITFGAPLIYLFSAEKPALFDHINRAYPCL